MFDLGWPELFLIAVVAVLFLGPKEIPVVMRALGNMVRRVKFMHFAISQQIDQMIDQHEQQTGDVGAETRAEKDADEALSMQNNVTDGGGSAEGRDAAKPTETPAEEKSR
jgi:sec-independent protein translocase protein TatB